MCDATWRSRAVVLLQWGMSSSGDADARPLHGHVRMDPGKAMSVRPLGGESRVHDTLLLSRRSVKTQDGDRQTDRQTDKLASRSRHCRERVCVESGWRLRVPDTD